MASNLIEKLFTEAVQTGGNYVEFRVSNNNVAFICDGGSRKSTRNYHRSSSEIKADERSLKSIDEKSLLFTNQLKKIQFTLSNGRTANFLRTDSEKFCSIIARKVTESKDKEYQYVRFVPDTSSPVGIAFAVKQISDGKYQIVPCKGKIMNGAIATGIPTDLRFVLSADFRLKNGMLDSKYEKENFQAIEEISSAMERAILNMRYIGLLGMPLFAVLPTAADEQDPLSEALIRTVRNVCDTFPVFKNQKGNFVGRNNIAYGAGEVTKLFDQRIAGIVLGEKYWGEAYVAGGREECFLKDLGITYYSRERFLTELFRKENTEDCNNIFENLSDRWLRSFYILCSESIEEEKTKRTIVDGFRKTRSIRAFKGNMQYPGEVTLATDISSVGNKTGVIKPGIISPSGKEDEYSDQLRQFFIKTIGIKEYSQKPEMESLADEMMNKKQPVDRVYAKKLLTLALFNESHPSEIDFHSYAIFPYESKRGISRTCADKLVIGKPYLREGTLLASATGREPIWSGLKDLLDQESLNKVLLFAERNGTIGAPAIIKQAASEHRNYTEMLYVSGRQGARDSNYDYIIPGLQDILKRRSLQLSKLVWYAITASADCKHFLYAEYSVDNRSIVNRCDSSLIQILRERTWVPGKDGKFYMPENINASEISDQFPFDRSTAILNALNFGSGIKRRKDFLKQLEKEAAREGFRLIPEKEYKDYLKWKQEKGT